MESSSYAFFGLTFYWLGRWALDPSAFGTTDDYNTALSIIKWLSITIFVIPAITDAISKWFLLKLFGED